MGEQWIETVGRNRIEENFLSIWIVWPLVQAVVRTWSKRESAQNTGKFLLVRTGPRKKKRL